MGILLASIALLCRRKKNGNISNFNKNDSLSIALIYVYIIWPALNCDPLTPLRINVKDNNQSEDYNYG